MSAVVMYSKVATFTLIVVAAVIVRPTYSYGEGMFSTGKSCVTKSIQGYGPATRLSFSNFALDCGHIRAISAPISREIRVQLTSVPQTDKVCVQVRARSSAELIWWYMIPPPASSDAFWEQCSSTTDERQDVSFVFNISLPVSLLCNVL